MKAKKALVLFAVMLALASAAAIGVILPDTYPTPEAISPQQTVPAAAEAPVPLAPQPGHPGGIYTQVVATCYGPIKFDSSRGITVYTADVKGTGHISLDGLSASIDFAADTREEAKVNFTVDDNREDVNTIYITAATQPGVEIDFDALSVDGEYNSNSDTVLDGKTLTDGTSLLQIDPWDEVYFWDDGDGVWEDTVDVIFYDSNTDGDYDPGTDTILAGAAGGPGVGGNYYNEDPWDNIMFYSDGDANYESTTIGAANEDAIVLDTAGNDVIKHVSPGIWVGISGSDDDLDAQLVIYGQPISSGYRYVTVTFTAE